MEYVIAHLVFLLLLVASLYSVEGRLDEDISVKRNAVKTIKTKYGDEYDCVGLYKQPAFQHRRLKNHKIQMMPSFVTQKDDVNPRGNIVSGISSDIVLEDSCPSGTVPIRRRSNAEISRAKAMFKQHFPSSYSISTQNNPLLVFAGLATGKQEATVYHGAGGYITISGPSVFSGQFSASVISIEGGDPDQFSAIRVGWMVNFDLFRDNSTHLYTIWGQAKDGKFQGCYNTDCPGFVQTDPSVALNMILSPVSVVRGPQYYVKLAVTQDNSTGNWWLTYGDNDKPVGYWPSSLFINLVNGAPSVRWGGMVYSNYAELPTMGNGDNGEIHSSHFRQVMLKYESSTSLNGTIDVPMGIIQTQCYKSGDNDYKGDFWGYSFYFGGEGGDVSQCSS